MHTTNKQRVIPNAHLKLERFYFELGLNCILGSFTLKGGSGNRRREKEREDDYMKKKNELKLVRNKRKARRRKMIT